VRRGSCRPRRSASGRSGIEGGGGWGFGARVSIRVTSPRTCEPRSQPWHACHMPSKSSTTAAISRCTSSEVSICRAYGNGAGHWLNCGSLSPRRQGRQSPRTVLKRPQPLVMDVGDWFLSPRRAASVSNVVATHTHTAIGIVLVSITMLTALGQANQSRMKSELDAQDTGGNVRRTSVCDQRSARQDASATRGGVLEGRVFDDTQTPVAGASVSVQRVELSSGMTRSIRNARTVVTDAEGNYRVSALQPGQYYISAVINTRASSADNSSHTPRGSQKRGFGATFYPPNGSISPSPTPRKIRPCITGGASPISSRNSVPR
jgi:Carboxypeptidase regulatory-like domain